MPLQDRPLDSLRRCCRSLPDQRRGLNATYDMADFAPFFMLSPSFLAHQRHLETGQGRSNCQTLFGMRKIPGDSEIRARLDAVEPAMFHPIFADLMAMFHFTYLAISATKAGKETRHAVQTFRPAIPQ